MDLITYTVYLESIEHSCYSYDIQVCIGIILNATVHSVNSSQREIRKRLGLKRELEEIEEEV